LPGNMPGLDQVMYTKKKLMDKPSKKKTHFDKYDIKKAELKGSKSNADVVVISPSEKHFQKEQEKLAIASENEKQKICMSLKEDSPSNFLTKLGLITEMIEDVTQFRIRMKRSRSRIHDQEQNIKNPSDEGVAVEATEAIWKLKKKAKVHEDFKLASNNKKPIKLWKGYKNNLGPNKKRYTKYRKSDVKDNQFPTCFGYEYFSAVDALDDNGFPDVEIFQEYFSDLSDDKLAVQLTDIVTSCVEPVRADNSSNSCPDPESSPGWLSDFKDDSVLGSCTENCFTDSDCRDNELCCANECGGHFCFRSKSAGSFRRNNSQQRSLCHNADIVLKCFYEKMKQKVCAQPEPPISF